MLSMLKIAILSTFFYLVMFLYYLLFKCSKNGLKMLNKHIFIIFVCFYVLNFVNLSLILLILLLFVNLFWFWLVWFPNGPPPKTKHKTLKTS